MALRLLELPQLRAVFFRLRTRDRRFGASLEYRYQRSRRGGFSLASPPLQAGRLWSESEKRETHEIEVISVAGRERLIANGIRIRASGTRNRDEYWIIAWRVVPRGRRANKEAVGTPAFPIEL